MNASEIEQLLSTNYSGVFKNTMLIQNSNDGIKTCQICRTPIDTIYEMCRACESNIDFMNGEHELSKSIKSSIYAIKNSGNQAYDMMKKYKGITPSKSDARLIFQILILALRKHAKCLKSIAGGDITHFAVIPSTNKNRLNTEHHFHRLVSPIFKKLLIPELKLTCSEHRIERNISLRRFGVSNPEILNKKSIVLLLDDSYTTGSNIQSGFLAIKNEVNCEIITYTVARILNTNWKASFDFIKNYLDKTLYNPKICPWTGKIGCAG